jgi:serine/threonine protein kinase
MDFNISKFVGEASEGPSKFDFSMLTHTGTLAFSSPELFEAGTYTEKVDLWSAGTVLYTMLCGYVPFESEK